MESRSMTKHKVVLVPFPFDDLSGTKVRPAVCLTNPVGPYRHIVLAFITSSVSSAGVPTDLVLDAGDPGFPTTGLRVSSTVQLHRMMTATTSLIRRDLGKLPPTLQTAVDVRLRQLFGLS
jgi:mRNA interferase MazF